MPQFAADIDTVTVEVTPANEGTELRLTQHGLRTGYEEATLAGRAEMSVLLEEALAAQLG